MNTIQVNNHSKSDEELSYLIQLFNLIKEIKTYGPTSELLDNIFPDSMSYPNLEEKSKFLELYRKARKYQHYEEDKELSQSEQDEKWELAHYFNELSDNLKSPLKYINEKETIISNLSIK